MRALLIFFLLAGCITHVKQQCPSCSWADGVKNAPRLRPGIDRLFVLVPGALGYGWEWDAAVDALRKSHTDFVVFWWDPWASLHLGADHLNAVLQTALWIEPSLKEVVVVAHSAGGILGAHAMAGLRVPARAHVELVTIGTPFAGMGAAPVGEEYFDPLGSPAVLSIGGRFHSYPRLPANVTVTEYVTRWPPDEVMQPRYGWNPAPPEIGPADAVHIDVDPKLDHNFVVARVVNDLLKRPAPRLNQADNAKATSVP